MWKLTPDALANGVKSTTRYRSKQPNKRGHRTSHYPQRQRAGAMGGKSAKKQLRHRARMHDAYRSDPFRTPSRSIPTPASFDDSFNPDFPLASVYPASPSYYSPSGSEIDAMEYQPDVYGTGSEQRMSQQMFHGLPHRPLSSSPLASYSDGYIQLPSDPAVPLFTRSPTDTPSPPASEPRTPDSQTLGWGDSIYIAMDDSSQADFDLSAYGIAGNSDIPRDQFLHDAIGNGE